MSRDPSHGSQWPAAPAASPRRNTTPPPPRPPPPPLDSFQSKHYPVFRRQAAQPQSSLAPSSSAASSSMATTSPLLDPAAATTGVNATDGPLASTGNTTLATTALDGLNTSTSLYTFTKTKPWTFTATPSKTTSGSAASQTTYVPGLVFNLSLGGTTDDTAVYSVPMTFGHDLSGDYSSRKRADPDWNGVSGQTLNMQVDLGSSDMWVASDLCTTSDCKGAPDLYNGSASLDTDMSLALKYQSGSVSGEMMWEQVTVGSFGIGYQAFVRASTVDNENLGDGNFTGLLGLSLPANSLVENAIPGTTGSEPDGATFLDNLFGGGASAPTQRIFALSLERRQDVRTSSSLSIGTTDSRYCREPCSPLFIPIVAQANLGKTGFLHWRVPIDGITAAMFSNPEKGTGLTTTNITLGPSVVDTSRSTPLAVLDSGGVAILVAKRAYADALYGAYNITASSDGLYRMPCTQQLAFSITIGGVPYPIHPLDMSWNDPNDVSMATCIGAIQYVSNLGNSGDFVLGSSFMKNVYSVFQYPDQKKTTTWQPTVGLVSLTNLSTASQDFYSVRSLHQSLTSVSGDGPNSQASGPGAAQNAASHRVVSTAIIVSCSVVGFFVLAAAAFGAWWFRLRRKLGADGHVDYKMSRVGGAGGGHQADRSISTVRSRKHEDTMRQKSYIDGISDYDSWRTETEDSTIRLDSLREEEANEKLVEQHAADEGYGSNLTRGSSFSNHARGSSLHQGLLATADPSSPPTHYTDFYPERRRGSSGSVVFTASPTADARLIDLDSPPPSAAANQPTHSHSVTQSSFGSFQAPSRPAATHAPPSTSTERERSLSMAGPFPSHNSDVGSISMAGPFPSPNRPPTVHRTTSDYEYHSILRQGDDNAYVQRTSGSRRESRSSTRDPAFSRSVSNN